MRQSGFGVIQLLITLALIGAILFFITKRQARQNQILNELDAPVSVVAPSQVPAQVGNQVQQIGANHEKAVDCASGDASACKIDATPAAPVATPSP